jgi:hypothetical protein
MAQAMECLTSKHKAKFKPQYTRLKKREEKNPEFETH